MIVRQADVFFKPTPHVKTLYVNVCCPSLLPASLHSQFAMTGRGWKVLTFEDFTFVFKIED